MQKNDLIRNFFTKRQAICKRYLSTENVSESDLRACEREVLGLTRATIRAGLYEIIPMLGNTPGMYNSLAALREFDRYIPDTDC